MNRSSTLSVSIALLLAVILINLIDSSEVQADDLTIVNTDLLPSADEIQQWHVLKDKAGPTHSGSPSWLNYMAIVESHFEESGMIDVTKDTFSYDRWYTSEYKADGKWTLSLGDTPIDVASYWAYSGSTGPSGVTAPLIYYDRGNPPKDLAGKIVVFEVAALPSRLPDMFEGPGYEFATDAENLTANAAVTSNQWYMANYVTRIGKLDTIVRDSGAAAALVIFELGPGRAAGLYTFPLLEPGVVGVPGLYLDRNAGQQVKPAALEGREATLTLLVEEEAVDSYFYTGFLPGKNYGTDKDEYVLMVTHTDGPNLTQENGGFGLMSVIRYFSHIPQADRPRTLVVMMDPQHFMPHRHMTDWFKLHPEIMSKVVATIGIEHLGQREYVEQGDDFVLSGQSEPALVFSQDNDFLIEQAINAVKAFEVPRTMVQSPPRGNQGIWAGMSDIAIKKNFPGYGMSTNMSAYWSTHARLDSFDKDLFRKQIGVAVHLTSVLMTADLNKMAVLRKD